MEELCGYFSTAWKNQVQTFHGVENHAHLLRGALQRGQPLKYGQVARGDGRPIEVARAARTQRGDFRAGTIAQECSQLLAEVGGVGVAE